MESQSTHSQEMIVLIRDIMNTIVLASEGKNHRWYIYFNRILEQLNKPHDLQQIAHKMRPIFGGMGTFNDLVLHKDPMTPLIEENDRLDDLKDSLFELCESILE